MSIRKKYGRKGRSLSSICSNSIGHTVSGAARILSSGRSQTICSQYILLNDDVIFSCLPENCLELYQCSMEPHAWAHAASSRLVVWTFVLFCWSISKWNSVKINSPFPCHRLFVTEWMMAWVVGSEETNFRSACVRFTTFRRVQIDSSLSPPEHYPIHALFTHRNIRFETLSLLFQSAYPSFIIHAREFASMPMLSACSCHLSRNL